MYKGLVKEKKRVYVKNKFLAPLTIEGISQQFQRLEIVIVAVFCLAMFQQMNKVFVDIVELTFRIFLAFFDMTGCLASIVCTKPPCKLFFATALSIICMT